MKKPLSSVAESVRARLLNLRTTPGEDYHELLVRFCLERLLYRLSISAHRERFVLKGAMLFALWQGFLHRRTRDLDLLGFGDPAPESVVAVFKEIVTQSVPVDDGIRGDPRLRGQTQLRRGGDGGGSLVIKGSYQKSD